PTPSFSLEPFAIGLAVGMGISVLSASIPAFLASSVTPLEGMRNIETTRSNRVMPWVGTAGLVIMVAAGVILFLSITGRISVDYASFGGVLFNFGGVLIAPLLMVPLALVAVWPLRAFAAVECSLAYKQLMRHRMRTSMTMGVLMVAGSTGVGMA